MAEVWMDSGRERRNGRQRAGREGGGERREAGAGGTLRPEADPDTAQTSSPHDEILVIPGEGPREETATSGWRGRLLHIPRR